MYLGLGLGPIIEGIRRRGGVVSLGPPLTGYDDVVLGQAPIAFWRLNEEAGPDTVAYDVSGNKHHGTYQDVNVKGSAAIFAGGTRSIRTTAAAQRVHIPTAAWLNVPVLSVSCFVVHEVQQVVKWIQKDNGSVGWSIGDHDGDRRFSAWVSFTAETKGAENPNPFTLNVGYHLAFTARAGSIKFYQDSGLVVDLTSNSDVYAPPEDLYLGTDAGANKLSHVAIWDRELTQAEITAQWNARGS